MGCHPGGAAPAGPVVQGVDCSGRCDEAPSPPQGGDTHSLGAGSTVCWSLAVECLPRTIVWFCPLPGGSPHLAQG